jgi:hypothetical protein
VRSEILEWNKRYIWWGIGKGGKIMKGISLVVVIVFTAEVQSEILEWNKRHIWWGIGKGGKIMKGISWVVVIVFAAEGSMILEGILSECCSR